MTETYIVDSCEYRVTGGTAAQNITLTLEVPADGDMAAVRAAFDTGKQQAQAAFNAAPLDIPGLGDAAYWVGSSGNTLLVLKGSVTFTLSAYTVKGNTPNQLLLEQAKTVLGRLP
jgi:hypothetical protein